MPAYNPSPAYSPLQPTAGGLAPGAPPAPPQPMSAPPPQPVSQAPAKPAFNPNAPFEVIAQEKPKFDPNAPFEVVDHAPEPGFLDRHPVIRGMVKSGLEQLPTAGAVGGGILGAGAGAGAGSVPLGMVGAGAGAGIGKALENIGEQYLLGELKSKKDMLVDPLISGAYGAAGEGAGQGVAQGISRLVGKDAASVAAKEASDALNQNAKGIAKPTAEEVAAAAARMGVKPTAGMLSDNYVPRALENSLSQSPSIPGYLIRNEQAPVHKGISDTVNGLLNDATSLSHAEGGRQMRNEVIAKMNEDYAPIQMAYDEAKQSTQHIPLNPQSQTRIANSIRNLESAQILPNSSEAKLANNFADATENVKNVDQIKMLRSKAMEIMRDPNASAGEKTVAADVRDRLDRFHNNSIMRGAIAVARDPEQGQEIGSQLVADVKGAGKAYKQYMQDMGTFNRGSGLAKTTDKTAQTLNKISNTPPEDMGDALFQTGDSEFLNFLKDKQPRAYALAKQQKLADIAAKSTAPNGEVSAPKFLQSIKSLGPEAREHLFGDGANDKLKDLQTVMQSIPGKVGGSDTPRGMEFHGLLNPLQQIRDVGRYGLLKNGEPMAGSLGSNAGSRAFTTGGQEGIKQGRDFADFLAHTFHPSDDSN